MVRRRSEKGRLTAVNFRKKTMIEAQAHVGDAVLPHSSHHADRIAADFRGASGGGGQSDTTAPE